MKYIFITLIAFPYLGYCQITLKTEVDKFTGDTIHKTGFIFLNGEGFYDDAISIQPDVKPGHPINMFLSLKESRPVCFQDGAKAIFLCENGTKDTLYSNYSLNCEGYMNFVIDGVVNRISAIDKFIVTAIRFYSSEGYFDIELINKEDFIKERKLLPEAIQKLKEVSRYPLYR